MNAHLSSHGPDLSLKANILPGQTPPATQHVASVFEVPLLSSILNTTSPWQPFVLLVFLLLLEYITLLSWLVDLPPPNVPPPPETRAYEPVLLRGVRGQGLVDQPFSCCHAQSFLVLVTKPPSNLGY